jgi:hypothetical protein
MLVFAFIILVESLLSKLTSSLTDIFSTSLPISNSMYFSDSQSAQYDSFLPFDQSDTGKDNGSSSSYKDLYTRIHNKLTGSVSTLVSVSEPDVAQQNPNNLLPSFSHDGVGESTLKKLFGISWLGRRSQQPETDLLVMTDEMSNRFRKAIVVAVNFSLFCCKSSL